MHGQNHIKFDIEIIIFFTSLKVTLKSGVTTLEIDLRFLFDKF